MRYLKPYKIFENKSVIDDYSSIIRSIKKILVRRVTAPSLYRSSYVKWDAAMFGQEYQWGWFKAAELKRLLELRNNRSKKQHMYDGFVNSFNKSETHKYMGWDVENFEEQLGIEKDLAFLCWLIPHLNISINELENAVEKYFKISWEEVAI